MERDERVIATFFIVTIALAIWTVTIPGTSMIVSALSYFLVH